MGRIKFIITFLLFAFYQSSLAQNTLVEKIDSVYNFLIKYGNDKTVPQCISDLDSIRDSNTSLFNDSINSIFNNTYGTALYMGFCFNDATPCLKAYLAYEDKLPKWQPSEKDLTANCILSDSYFKSGNIDSAETTIREVLIKYDGIIDKYLYSRACYDVVLEICQERNDSTLLDDIHRAKQLCTFKYLKSLQGPNGTMEQALKDLNAYINGENLSIAGFDKNQYYRFRKWHADFLNYHKDYYEAEYEYKRLINMIKERNDTSVICQQSYLGLAYAYNNSYSAKELQEIIKPACDYYDGISTKDSKNTYALFLNQVGIMYAREDSFDLSYNMYLKAIKIVPDDSSKLILKNNLSVVLYKMSNYYLSKGDNKKTKDILKQAARICTDERMLEKIKQAQDAIN